MKRVLSVILAALIAVTLLSALSFSASAADHVSNPGNNLLKDYDAAHDGELLYEAQFGLDYGCYKPRIFSIADTRTAAELTVDEGGYGVTETVAFLEGGTNNTGSVGKLWYGAEVEGLPFGEGYKYTVKYKIRHQNDGAGTGNNGFFISGNADVTDYNASYGAYGNLTVETGAFVDVFRGGSHNTGMTLSSGSYIKFTNYVGVLQPPVADADGYVDCALEVDGYNYSFYINGNYFDTAKMDTSGTQYAIPEKLALIFYTYTSGGGVKDVQVIKGCEHVESVITTAPPKTTAAPSDDTTPEPDDTTAKPADDTTKAEEVTTAETTATPSKTAAPADTGEKNENKGCGGFSAAGLLLVAALGCAITVVVKKK